MSKGILSNKGTILLPSCVFSRNLSSFFGIIGTTSRELGKFAYPIGLDGRTRIFFYPEVVFMRKLSGSMVIKRAPVSAVGTTPTGYRGGFWVGLETTPTLL